jgi:hypothetical protein
MEGLDASTMGLGPCGHFSFLLRFRMHLFQNCDPSFPRVYIDADVVFTLPFHGLLGYEIPFGNNKFSQWRNEGVVVSSLPC